MDTFYADALPLGSARSGTNSRFALIKCRRASTVCFRIVSMWFLYLLYWLCKFLTLYLNLTKAKETHLSTA